MGLNWIWFALTIFVIVIDITTSSFTFSWLAIGFLPAFIAGFFIGFTGQLWIALILGTIAIIYGLKISKKYIIKNLPQEKLLVGKYEGKQFTADFTLAKSSECRIKVNEVYWTAKNVGEVINFGDVYTIISISENKLIVKRGVV